MLDMKRREFITLPGGAASAWPLAAGAQQAGKVYRMAFFSAGEPIQPKTRSIFVNGLHELGWIEGKTFCLRAGLPKIGSSVCRGLRQS